MAIVVDASLVVVLVSADPRAALVELWFPHWEATGEDLHAPALLPYEVASALTRLVKAGRMAAADVATAWAIASALPITLHPEVDGRRVIEIALQLGRTSAYDAAYLALTEQVGATLWTLDGSLAHNASGLGFRVELLDKPPS